jgi:hypothetical protein
MATARATRRETAVLALVLAVVIIGIGIVGLSLWGRANYGVFGWSATPTRLGYCDQTYTLLDEQPRTWDQVVARDPQAASALILEPTLGTLPVGAPLPSSHAAGAGYNGCGPLVVLHLGSGYRMYYKLGGP